MAAPYDRQSDLQSPLIDTAYRLGAERPGRLNPLVLMSDPDRTPDIVELARHMPERSALIYRHFGADEREDIATRLRNITLGRDIQFLIGADPELALSVKADGVHFRRDADLTKAQEWRARQPDWIITQAALKTGDYSAPMTPLDALFFSSVFPSDSPSAGTPRTVESLSKECAARDIPIFALGGLTDTNAPQILKSGAAGIAAIGGLAHILRRNASMTDPIKAKPKQAVSISKTEKGEMILFEADVEGESAMGELTLKRVTDGVWNANHTGVPSEIGGRGVGKALVQAMVEDARQQGYKIIPGCPFVAKLFERKPEWAEGIVAER